MLFHKPLPLSIMSLFLCLLFRSSTGSVMRWHWRVSTLSEQLREREFDETLSPLLLLDTHTLYRNTLKRPLLWETEHETDHAPLWRDMALDVMLQDKQSTSAKKEKMKQQTFEKKKMDTILLFSSLLSMSSIHMCILDCDVILYSTF